MTPLLVAEGIEGGYGDTRVVSGVHLDMSPGEILGILGRNGVGKTTLLRLLTGQLPLSRGAIQWDGAPLPSGRPHLLRGLGISYAPQENVVFDGLSVRANLLLGGGDPALRAALLDEFPRIGERLNQRAGALSGGEKKLVSFVRTLSEGARLTLLDEPSEGVQQENIDRMASHLRAAAAQGRAVILVEQNLHFLMQVADRALVMDHGAAVYSGPLESRAFLEGFLHV